MKYCLKWRATSTVICVLIVFICCKKREISSATNNYIAPESNSNKIENHTVKRLTSVEDIISKIDKKEDIYDIIDLANNLVKHDTRISDYLFTRLDEYPDDKEAICLYMQKAGVSDVMIPKVCEYLASGGTEIVLLERVVAQKPHLAINKLVELLATDLNINNRVVMEITLEKVIKNIDIVDDEITNKLIRIYLNNNNDIWPAIKHIKPNPLKKLFEITNECTNTQWLHLHFLLSQYNKETIPYIIEVMNGNNDNSKNRVISFLKHEHELRNSLYKEIIIWIRKCYNYKMIADLIGLLFETAKLDENITKEIVLFLVEIFNESSSSYVCTFIAYDLQDLIANNEDLRGIVKLKIYHNNDKNKVYLIDRILGN